MISVHNFQKIRVVLLDDSKQFILDNWELLDENQRRMAEMIGIKKDGDNHGARDS